MMIPQIISRQCIRLRLAIKDLFLPKKYIDFKRHLPLMPLCVKPGSNRKGEHNGKSKLKTKDVLDIRKQYALGCYSYKQLAKRFNISRTTIGDIILRRTWRHL